MKEYHLNTAPLTFLSILDIRIKEEVGEHGTATVTGYIEDEMEEEYLAYLTGEVWEKLEKVGKDGEREILFYGMITDFSIDSGYHQKKMTLQITTGSCLLDREKHLRSWQESSVTCEQIFRMLCSEYPGSSVTFNSPLEEAEGKLVLQYYETDWQFLKRLASRKHKFLVAESGRKGAVFSYDLPKGEPAEFPEHGKYTVKKELEEYRKKKSSGLLSLQEEDSLIYVVQCRDSHRIGDYMTIHGRKLFICKIQSRLEKGELLHDCYLKLQKGMEVPEIRQEEMTGAALEAVIKKVKEDKVQAVILADENAGQEINIWYPYATVYSTPDGTGWYCMPEPGDRVRLIIPGGEEKEAFVASSVHMETDSADRKDPDVKSLKSKYQKEVRFTPETIVITNNQGTRIELTDKEGIHIVSAHSVMLEAAEDLTISSDTGSLIIAGTSSVSLKQGGTGIDLNKGITFTGGELKVQ
ncbi:MAG: hypothetical protein J6C64_05185 [Lachnospiraceae bacterium]|nr:hypothetical protein [Lachnospiraceae bacterium]